ncbi:hypothetical protein ElyMa_004858800 [Elysia marginata]|uniref:Uncharacterized protein n=1 Tax=Elysia marginata TaxID=1093978 RepID=A0AAV4ITQ2_9GAST|nr:hypothetical protein ElyMa_004858800 [Elysia marginata]
MHFRQEPCQQPKICPRSDGKEENKVKIHIIMKAPIQDAIPASVSLIQVILGHPLALRPLLCSFPQASITDDFRPVNADDTSHTSVAEGL